MTKQDFFNLVCAPAQAASVLSGLPWMISAVQAALESQWGAKAPGCNYFGITHVHGDLPDLPLETHEDMFPATLYAEIQAGRIVKLLGAGVPIQDSPKLRYPVLRMFGAWSSIEANFRARDQIIETEPRYAPACLLWHSDANLEGYVKAFAAHWASDSNYAQEILVTYHANLGLMQNAVTLSKAAKPVSQSV